MVQRVVVVEALPGEDQVKVDVSHQIQLDADQRFEGEDDVPVGQVVDGDGLARERLDEDLRAAAEPHRQIWRPCSERPCKGRRWHATWACWCGRHFLIWPAPADDVVDPTLHGIKLRLHRGVHRVEPVNLMSKLLARGGGLFAVPACGYHAIRDPIAEGLVLLLCSLLHLDGGNGEADRLLLAAPGCRDCSRKSTTDDRIDTATEIAGLCELIDKGARQAVDGRLEDADFNRDLIADTRDVVELLALVLIYTLRESVDESDNLAGRRFLRNNELC